MTRLRTASVRPRRPSFRPSCEPLEERLAPATHTWSGAVNTVWSHNGNWIGGSPYQDSSATLIFPANPTRYTTIHDLGLGYWVAQGITIQGSGYEISGNPIRLGPSGITATNATGANTVHCGITTQGTAFRPVTIANTGATLNLTGPLTNGVVYPIPAPIPLGLTKTGAGTLVLSGNNSHSLGTRLDSGPLVVGSDTALGIGPLTLNGGSLRASRFVILANAFTVGGPAVFDGSQNMTFTGAGTLSAALATNTAGTLRFHGPLSGPGYVFVNGPGTVVLANPANSYAGGTAVYGGTLRLGASNVIPNTSAVAVAAAGHLDVAGHLDTIGSLGGAGSVTLGPTGGLVTGVSNATTTFSGSLSGVGNVQKYGTGTWTLTGAVNVGHTIVWAGTLDVRTGFVSSLFTVVGGTVRVDAAGYVYTPGNYVQQGGRTTLDHGGIYAALVDVQNGILDGNGSIVGNLRNDGRIDVGGAAAAGYLYVLGGNYTQTAAGILNVELAGPDIATQYDFLYVEGTATLAGTLNVSRLGGYVPNPDDYFFPLYTGGLTSGTFGTITGLPLGGGRELMPYYWDNGLILWAT